MWYQSGSPTHGRGSLDEGRIRSQLFSDPDQHGIVVRTAVGISGVDCCGIVLLVVVHEPRFVCIDVPYRNTSYICRERFGSKNVIETAALSVIDERIIQTEGLRGGRVSLILHASRLGH